MIRGLLLLICSLLVVGVMVTARRQPGLFRYGAGPDGSVLDLLPPPFPGKDELRLVLIGADDRPGLPGRSDTLMVLYMRPAAGRAALLSIPRDLRVVVPGYGHTKVNHAYSHGGAALTRTTVEGLLGERMDGHVVVNLEGFVKAVDALGGVDLEVEDYEGRGRGMNYDCPGDGLVIHLKPGKQHLTGYKAMGYVRYRMSNVPGAGSTDFQRADRQQKFLRALVAQKLRPGNLRQLWKAGQEVWKCLDSSLTWREGLDLARVLKATGTAGLKTVTLPALDEKRHGVYYAGVDDAKFTVVREEIATHLAGRATVLVTPRAEVLNASGRPGAAAAAADKLEAAGFAITEVGNAPTSGASRTTVLHRGDGREIAQRAVTVLGHGTLELDDSGPTPADQPHIQVLVGKDLVGE